VVAEGEAVAAATGHHGAVTMIGKARPAECMCPGLRKTVLTLSFDVTPSIFLSQVIPKRQLIKAGAPILALLNSVPSCKVPLTLTPRKLLEMVLLLIQRVGRRLQLTPLAGMHPLLTQLL